MRSRRRRRSERNRRIMSTINSRMRCLISRSRMRIITGRSKKTRIRIGSQIILSRRSRSVRISGRRIRRRITVNSWSRGRCI